MTTAHGGLRPGRVVARSLGCGACCGALFGILTLAVFLIAVGLTNGDPASLVGILAFGPYAAAVGGVIGTACGILACVPVLLVGGADWRNPGRSSRARRGRASLAGGGGAALLPAVLGVWQAAQGAEGWASAWLCVTALAATGGLALGPYVLYGRRVRVRPARNRGECNGAGPAGRAAAG